MANYRMIACSVGDYEPTMSIESIEALDEFEQDYFIVKESDNLDSLRAEAVSIWKGWCEAEPDDAWDDYDDALRKELETYRQEEEETLLNLEVGHTSKNVCSTNDWIRIEEAND